MGLFSKLTCECCGKTSRIDVSTYEGSEGPKTLCDDCLEKMYPYNNDYEKYCKFVSLDTPSFFNYDDRLKTCNCYKNLALDLPAFSGPDDYLINNDIDHVKSISIGSVLITKHFTCVEHNKNLVIKNEDIFAIAIEPAYALSNKVHNAQVSSIIFYTTNKDFPYFVTLAILDECFSDKLSFKKNKAEKLLAPFLKNTYQNLKYDITPVKALSKAIKNDESFNIMYNRKDYIKKIVETSSLLFSIGTSKANKILDAEELLNENRGWSNEFCEKLNYNL